VDLDVAGSNPVTRPNLFNVLETESGRLLFWCVDLGSVLGSRSDRADMQKSPALGVPGLGSVPFKISANEDRHAISAIDREQVNLTDL